MAYSKIIVGALVLGIVALLIFSAPAEAFISSIEIKNSNVDKGEKVIINADVKTSEGDSPKDINYFIFQLRGPNNTDCKFLPNATILSGCNGIEINDVSPEPIGDCKSYGYGTGCDLKFKISFDTTDYENGTYASSLIINSKGIDTEIAGKDISINVTRKVCSIRANDGKLIVDNMQFEKNKINFYIPLKNANKGGGYLTGQKGRDRFLYRFNIGEALINNKNIVKVKVTGKYRIGNGKFIDEAAVLTFDRIENVTSLMGDNIKMSGMKISFRQFC